MMHTAAPQLERPRQVRGGLVGPIALIAAGIVLLLNNLGMIGWDVWYSFARLWPILLIGIGLDLIVARRSAALSLLIGAATVAAFAAGAWYYGAQPSVPAAGGQDVAYALDGARSADVSLSLNAGEIRLGALPAGDDLLRGTVSLGRGERLEREFAVQNGEARLKLRADGLRMTVGPADPSTPWELKLNGQVPLKLHISAGAGQAALDLSRLQVTSLDVSAGVGETDLTLPERGRLTASISAGVGKTVVRIPAGLAARIHASGGISNVQVDGRFTRQGDTYTSSDYASADNRVDVEISSGVGEIRVVTLADE